MSKKNTKKPTAKKPVAKKKLQKVVKKPQKKVVKKAPKKVVSATDFLTRNELKMYAKIIQHYVRNRPVNDTPAPGDRDPEEIKHREMILLGDKYDDIVHALPTEEDKKESVPCPASPTSEIIREFLEAPEKDFGILVDVAASFNISTESLKKFMNYLLSVRLIRVGDLVEYKMSITDFINGLKRKKREAENKASDALDDAAKAAVDNAETTSMGGPGHTCT
jgi:hypothetical protein